MRQFSSSLRSIAEMHVLEVYEESVRNGALKADPAQAAAVDRLDKLQAAIEKPKGFFKKDAPQKGLYLVGSIGRGKTMLMDMFFQSVEIPHKTRVHFHAFMQDVHARLHAGRKSSTRDPIGPVA